MALLKSIATVGGFTMGSRVLGFVRDILVAGILGAGPVADAFFIAFKFPNLFRRLFAEGAFTAAFVPIYAGELEEKGQEKAQTFANQALSILFWVLFVFVALVELFMPWIMQVLAPGFVSAPDKFDLAVLLTRITFPYLLFISLVSLFAGVMNSFGRFAAAAATPILLNICLITAILGLTPHMPSPGHALAWGVCGAGLVQFIWMWGHCRAKGIRFSLPLPRLTDKIKTLLKRIVPVAVGAGIYQINLVVDMVIASLLPTGAISYLFYADRVNQLPLGVVGVAVGTALLPLLTRQLRAGDNTAAMNSQNRALEFALLLTLPAAFALAVIAEPVITVLFERGAFGPEQSAATARALMVYALGLPAYVLVKALTPGFFAREDTKTPVKISIVCLFINIGLNLALMGPFQHVGIAMATAVSAWANALGLAMVLRKRGQLNLDARLKARLPRTFIAGAIMAFALFAEYQGLAGWFAGSQMERITALILLVCTGLLVFGLAAQVLGAASIRDIKALRRGQGQPNSGD